jgi:hypothetical protein
LDTPGLGWGVNAETEFTVASRFNQEVYGLCSTCLDRPRLSAIFLASTHPDALFTLKVWVGGLSDPFDPGNLVLEQYVGTIPVNELVIVELDDIIEIDLYRELWIGYHVYTPDGNPAALNSCVGNADYGNLIFWDGEWTTLYSLETETTLYGRFWFLGGVLQPPTIVSDAFIGYNVYLLDIDSFYEELELLTEIPISETNFTHLNVGAGYQNYRISAVYSLGESELRYIFVNNPNLIINTFPWEYDNDNRVFSTSNEMWFMSESGENTSRWIRRNFTSTTRGFESSFGNIVPSASNSWLFMPMAMLPEIDENHRIYFRYAYRSERHSQLHSVKISNTDREVESFTDLCYIAGNVNTWTIESTDITEYAGENVYIAIVHHFNNVSDMLQTGQFAFEILPILLENDKIVDSSPNVLIENYPNPFNPETMISFSIPNEGTISINVYNIRGQKVRNLVNGDYSSGHHSVVWDGTNDSGVSVGSGVYLYRINAGEFTATRKMVLMK